MLRHHRYLSMVCARMNNRIVIEADCFIEANPRANLIRTASTLVNVDPTCKEEVVQNVIELRMKHFDHGGKDTDFHKIFQ
jgi:hypothetical protein